MVEHGEDLGKDSDKNLSYSNAVLRKMEAM